MSPRTGRPHNDNPKDIRIQIRLDQNTLDTLDKCAKSKQTTRSGIIRTGIELVNETLKKNSGNEKPSK